MRIDVITEIKTLFFISDTGYTQNMTLPEIEKWAKDRLRSIDILIREGGTEPKLVKADKKLLKVQFTPEGE